MVLADSNENNLRNIRLDSRINPRQSIILDISIKDNNPKTTKNKPNYKLNDISKVILFLWKISLD